MSRLLDDDDDLDAPPEREVTLSTGAILGLFFGLVLLCGVFFAFGYSVGRHKPELPESVAAEPSAAPATANFNSFKPAAGSPVGSSPTAVAAPVVSPSDARAQASGSQPSRPTTQQNSSPGLAAAAQAEPPAPIVRSTPPYAAYDTPSAAQSSFMVQVAAVSHQEDADLLVSALRTRGYAVTARTSPADAFIHIQVGPFSSRRDADAMRNRLLTDGYNAIVK